MKIMCDSGAYSSFTKVFSKVEKNPEGNRYKNVDFSYADEKEFKAYLEEYIKFLLNNKQHFEVCVTLDVIGNPEKTWEIQKYIESFGLSPLPVYHFDEDIKWLKKYIDNYDYVGIGGLTKDIAKRRWITKFGNAAFDVICNPKTSLPRVKIHGFAMTSPEIIYNYPFYSVDSTSWTQYGKYGLIIVPKRKGDKYDYSKTPWILGITDRSPKAKKDNYAHFDNLPLMTKNLILQYMEEKNTTIKILKEEYIQRDMFNLEYYLDLEKSIPKWPWPWRRKHQVSKLW